MPLDALIFTLYPVFEGRMGCKLVWGDVLRLNGGDRTTTIKPMFVDGSPSCQTLGRSVID